MVTVEFSEDFQKRLDKLNDAATKERLKKQIAKIVYYPETGKPMRYERKGQREVYIAPFRLTYAYLKDEDKLIMLDFYHKDEQ